MKFLVTLVFSLIMTLSYAQLVGGDVIAEKRDVVPETNFTMEGAHQGWAVMTLAVDREGNVTSAQLKETNLKSTVDKIQIKKYAMTIKFIAGTHFPKFHHAEVKITMIPYENPPEELEIVID
ncbi:MAG: hypothetical protein Crog4KO_06080 [Crocinitomicaceae bacterium]